jgi:CHAD domain-containing protein
MSDTADNERALVKFADELLVGLRDSVVSALRDFDAEGIHDARVATRRLAAALDLLGPVLSVGPRKKFGRVLKKLRGRLGPLRDLDVMIEHLKELAEDSTSGVDSEETSQRAEAAVSASSAPSPHAKAIAWLVAYLEDQRTAARKKSTRKRTIPRIMESLSTWWTLHDELAEADEAAQTLLANSIHLQLDTFTEQAEDPAGAGGEKGAKSEKGVKGEEGAFARHDPHALRKTGKLLRYTLELADQTGHSLPEGALKAFKKLQDALGIWHDYAVLAEAAMRASMDQMLAYHDSDLQLEVLDLAGFAVGRSARALTRFDRMWKRRGEVLVTGIREVFPLTIDPATSEKISSDSDGSTAGEITSPSADPDPAGSEQTPPTELLPPGAAAAG